MARGLWQRLFRISRESWISPGSSTQLFEIGFEGFRRGKRGRTLWRCAFISVFWVIWLERNARIFEGKEDFLDVCRDRVHFLASFWVSKLKAFQRIPLFIIKSDWKSVFLVFLFIFSAFLVDSLYPFVSFRFILIILSLRC